MIPTLITPFQRYLVLGPTMVLSLLLGWAGCPLLPRITASVAVGAVLILVVSRLQRRRVS